MRLLLGSLAAAALATIGVPAATAQAATTAGAGSGAAAVGTARENEVVRLVNVQRAQKGCRAVRHHPQLHKAARAHSADMAEHRYFFSRSRDGRSFTERIEDAGFKHGRHLAENLAKGQRTPAMVVGAWMDAAGTRATILDCRYTYIGVGAAEDADGAIYWTQDFATK
ncbi:CAP domain-containing protein [Actinomadura sp. ATCC 31491]|uniref:CAP domain-containing protein n=1 Tax=Actinomadura luzonensis TaxID=2805427 RepID=A0ABT0FM39_9ACTN|nr:CAP domain-containing protein [Actinomadura luzonensis]MCK2213398.1 CAP domain-containing protein [Actinomadura luzonensis]